MVAPDLPAQLPPGVAEKLGVYVYALRDPRNHTIFYVGKGTGDRIFSHVWVAMGKGNRVENGIEHDSETVTSAKNDRITDIYASGSSVEHFILRRNIVPPESSDTLAFQFEQVLIAAFRLSENDIDNPTLANIQGGHTSGEFIVEPIEETIQQLTAEPAGPIDKPFVVLVSKNPILKTCNDEEMYARMREWWQARHVSTIPNVPVFIVHAALIRAVFRAEKWEQNPDHPTDWRFQGVIDPQLDARYRGKVLSYNDMEPPRKNWSTKGWHRYT